MSQRSKFLARLLGPTAVMLGVTEFANAQIFLNQDPAVVYFNGTVLFVSGLSIILRHNRWTPSWSLLITTLGWLALVLGFSRMMWPTARVGGDGAGVSASQAFLFGVGVVLILKGYGRG